MNTRQRKWIILALLILIPALGYVWHNHSKRNPFDKVTWLKEHPGANGRYVQYTPVLTSDKTIELGPTVGADFASLRFKDIDKDGVKEAIIETELFFDFGEYRSPERHVLKHDIDSNGIPKFTLTQSESIGQSGFAE